MYKSREIDRVLNGSVPQPTQIGGGGAHLRGVNSRSVGCSCSGVRRSSAIMVPSVERPVVEDPSQARDIRFEVAETIQRIAMTPCSSLDMSIMSCPSGHSSRSSNSSSSNTSSGLPQVMMAFTSSNDEEDVRHLAVERLSKEMSELFCWAKPAARAAATGRRHSSFSSSSGGSGLSEGSGEELMGDPVASPRVVSPSRESGAKAQTSFMPLPSISFPSNFPVGRTEADKRGNSQFELQQQQFPPPSSKQVLRLGPSVGQPLLEEHNVSSEPIPHRIGAKCHHIYYWTRLRAKKGMSHYVCRYCGIKWRLPSRGGTHKLDLKQKEDIIANHPSPTTDSAKASASRNRNHLGDDILCTSGGRSIGGGNKSNNNNNNNNRGGHLTLLQLQDFLNQFGPGIDDVEMPTTMPLPVTTTANSTALITSPESSLLAPAMMGVTPFLHEEILGHLQADVLEVEDTEGTLEGLKPDFVKSSDPISLRLVRANPLAVIPTSTSGDAVMTSTSVNKQLLLGSWEGNTHPYAAAGLPPNPALAVYGGPIIAKPGGPSMLNGFSALL